MTLTLQSTESFIQVMQYRLHTLEGKSAYKITESERLSKILNFVVLNLDTEFCGFDGYEIFLKLSGVGVGGYVLSNYN